MRHWQYYSVNRQHEGRPELRTFFSAIRNGGMRPLCEDSAMATIEHGTRLTRTAALEGFAVRAVNSIANFFRAWRNRREFYRLGDMSDSELADIGLTRTDLHVVSGGPFGLDPTTRLSRIARARTENMEDIARKVC